MIPTHERIPRHADCLQWDGNNTQAVMERLAQHGMIGELFRDIHIQVYKEGSYSDTLNIWDWLVERENGQLCFYDDETHALMYRPISDELERLREFISDVYDIEMDQKVVDRIMELSLKHGVMGARVDKSLKAHK